MTERFSNGLQFSAAYTWSHAIDDSTADVLSTYLTPRRPEDSTNLALDRSNSALDHRQRFTFEALYDMPFFKHSNWFMKNIVGNWEFVPVYYYQTGHGGRSERSGLQSERRFRRRPRDHQPGRTGQRGLRCDAAAEQRRPDAWLTWPAIRTPATSGQAPGTLPNGGRNTAQLPPIDDVDMTFAKNFNITESKKLQFSARFFNLFNHPQYVGGYVSDVMPATNTTTNGSTQNNPTSGAVHSYLEPQSGIFLQPSQAFSSNPRQIQFALKFIF